MPTRNPQLLDSNEFIDVLDYQFSGNDFTVSNKRLFIEAYREEGSIHHAALAVGISRKTAHNWLNNDEQFHEAFCDCREDTYDKAESSVFKKAIAGDSLLLMFYLKAHRPKFRDRMTVDFEQVDRDINEYLQRRQLPATTTQFLDTQLDNGTYTANPTPVSLEQKDNTSTTTLDVGTPTINDD